MCGFFISKFSLKTQYICPMEYIKTLMATTELNKAQIQHLYNRFCLISAPLGGEPTKHLMKRNFLAVGNLMRNPVTPLLLSAMFGDRRVLSFVDFAKFLSTFQANELDTKPETIEMAKNKKLRMLFNMYDANKDGQITKAELFRIVHKIYSDFVDDNYIMRLVDIMMTEMDVSLNDVIHFDDFCFAMQVFDISETMVTKIPEARLSKLQRQELETQERDWSRRMSTTSNQSAG